MSTGDLRQVWQAVIYAERLKVNELPDHAKNGALWMLVAPGRLCPTYSNLVSLSLATAAGAVDYA